MSAVTPARVVAVAAMTAVWLALWRAVTPGFVATGLVVAVVVLVVTGSGGLAGGATVHPGPALVYLARFGRDLLVASAVIMWEVVTPRDRTRTGVVAVPLEGDSDIVTTIVANTISLVPGTLTLDVRRDPTVLYVHALHLRDPEDLRAEIRLLERRAAAAFGRREDGPRPAADRSRAPEPPEEST